MNEIEPWIKEDLEAAHVFSGCKWAPGHLFGFKPCGLRGAYADAYAELTRSRWSMKDRSGACMREIKRWIKEDLEAAGSIRRNQEHIGAIRSI